MGSEMCIRDSFSLWVLAGVLYLYDMMRSHFQVMHEQLSDEAFEQYTTLATKMFVKEPQQKDVSGPELTMPALRRVLGAPQDVAGEELREVERPPSGLLYSTEVTAMFSQEHATAMIDMEARQLTAMLKKRKKTMHGWLNALSEDNHVVALFNPESYRREVFTKRSVFFLVEVLSFLFVACVYAPGDFGEEPAYLCPGESTSGPGGGGLIQFPRFDDGYDVVSFASWVVFNLFYDAMVNTFWLWPAGLLLWALYVVGGNIHRTRELHAARLLELTRPEEVMTPFEIDDATEVRVAKNMLHAAQLVLQRLTNAIRWRKQYLDLPPRLKRFLDVWLGLTIPQHLSLIHI